MNNTLCSVLINSCDKYEDAWYPFFELIKKYWKNCSYPFYLNTETKSYAHKGINLTVLNSGHNECSWGQRIKKCLNRIETPYVILFLEDFFLQQPVDQEELENCIEIMEGDPNIVAIYFKHTTSFDTPSPVYANYIEMTENKDCKLNLQAGLWRKNDLIDLVQDDDSPWTFETDGYIRVKRDQVFLCSKAGTHTNMSGCVFPYLTDRRLGYGIWAGKWLWNNDKLFKRNGIQVAPVALERFGRIDLIRYYWKRIKEKLRDRIIRQ